MYVDVDSWSERYRPLLVDTSARRILIANIRGSSQERDLLVPPNCEGFGRIRHFRRKGNPEWPDDPLPQDPACRALDLCRTDLIQAQLFQCAACNFRCWYCFVPVELLEADPGHSDWLGLSRMLDLYLDQASPPPVIDLSGGQPDLVPEWVPWMMVALQDRGLDSKVFLWSDDNLSTDFYWRFLSDADKELVATYRNYGRVACFKGFDEQSFLFNTGADPCLFQRQLDLMRRLLGEGMDIYAYVTLTTATCLDIKSRIRRFVDLLQELHENMPLRTVPLEITCFTPTKANLTPERATSLCNQFEAVACWQTELENRFSAQWRAQSITDVPLSSRRPDTMRKS